MFSNLPNGTKIALQIVALVVVIAVIVTSLTMLGLVKPKSAFQPVRLRVEASGGYALLTLKIGNELSYSKATVNTPWTKTLDIPSGTEVYLLAANPTQTGKVSCSIVLGSIPWKSASQVAPKDGVACAGIIP